jgi:hypothetical protein
VNCSLPISKECLPFALIGEIIQNKQDDTDIIELSIFYFIFKNFPELANSPKRNEKYSLA